MASFLFTSGVGRRILLLEKNAQKLATGEKIVPLGAARDEIGKIDKAVTQQLAVQAQEIIRSEERFREQFIILQSVLDSIGDGVVVANVQGEFLIFNPAAERLLGLGSVNITPDQWSETYGIFLPDTNVTGEAGAKRIVLVGDLGKKFGLAGLVIESARDPLRRDKAAVEICADTRLDLRGNGHFVRDDKGQVLHRQQVPRRAFKRHNFVAERPISAFLRS